MPSPRICRRISQFWAQFLGGLLTGKGRASDWTRRRSPVLFADSLWS